MPATLSKCFRCGSAEIGDRPVEEFVRQGPYVVALRFSTNACSNCGERYFTREQAVLIEDVKGRLQRGQLEGFRVTGEVLELAEA
jgi:hypothetical protein